MQHKSYVHKIVNYVSRQQHVTSVNLDIIGMNKHYYVRKFALLRVVNHVRILIAMFVKMECSLVLMEIAYHSFKIPQLMQMLDIL